MELSLVKQSFTLVAMLLTLLVGIPQKQAREIGRKRRTGKTECVKQEEKRKKKRRADSGLCQLHRQPHRRHTAGDKPLRKGFPLKKARSIAAEKYPDIVCVSLWKLSQTNPHGHFITITRYLSSAQYNSHHHCKNGLWKSERAVVSIPVFFSDQQQRSEWVLLVKKSFLNFLIPFRLHLCKFLIVSSALLWSFLLGFCYYCWWHGLFFVIFKIHTFKQKLNSKTFNLDGCLKTLYSWPKQSKRIIKKTEKILRAFLEREREKRAEKCMRKYNKLLHCLLLFLNCALLLELTSGSQKSKNRTLKYL